MAQTDYVIVGAGSAGCALAARLTEDPDIQVTVLEAGGPDSAEAIFVPGRVADALGHRGRLGLRDDARSRAAPARSTSGRAGACWAARARSTGWSTSAATRATGTPGPTTAAPAGTTLRCCRS